MGELDVLMPALGDAITDGDLALVPLAEAHRAELGRACAEDADIWAIYPNDWSPARFDVNFEALLANPTRHPFGIVLSEPLATTPQQTRLIGMTAFINHDPARQIVEIGNSYLRPAARGTGLNGRVKRLLLDRAFASGIRRVEFRIDERNRRSQAAVVKLGAVREGMMRAERITWSGHVRDTALFSILKEEWS